MSARLLMPPLPPLPPSPAPHWTSPAVGGTPQPTSCSTPMRRYHPNHTPSPVVSVEELPKDLDWCNKDGTDYCTSSWNQVSHYYPAASDVRQGSPQLLPQSPGLSLPLPLSSSPTRSTYPITGKGRSRGAQSTATRGNKGVGVWGGWLLWGWRAGGSESPTVRQHHLQQPALASGGPPPLPPPIPPHTAAAATCTPPCP